MEVDIFAPGVHIYSTMPENAYKAQDGTSMASPVVSGIAALIMSYYPNLSTVQIKNILLETATKPSNLMVLKPVVPKKFQMCFFLICLFLVELLTLMKRLKEQKKLVINE